MSQPRAIDFEDGIAMIVTDLHGMGRVYFRLRDRFLKLRDRGEVSRLILCGDLIHRTKPDPEDASLEMLVDVMRLQEELGPQTVTMLLGNHELPHIYSISLSKGDIEFTPAFEAAIARVDSDPNARYRRPDITEFLLDLPFYARTKAGVLVTHAGATPVIRSPETAARVLDFDHRNLLERVDAEIRARYDLDAIFQSSRFVEQARYFLAVSGPDDPRLPNMLRSLYLNDMAEWELLWEVLFARNELGSSISAYSEVAEEFLRHISAVSPWEQRVMTAGHIGVEYGYSVLTPQHLRLASFAHSDPKEEGRYLLLNCAEPVQNAYDLLPGLRRTFERDMPPRVEKR